MATPVPVASPINPSSPILSPSSSPGAVAPIPGSPAVSGTSTGSGSTRGRGGSADGMPALNKTAGKSSQDPDNRRVTIWNRLQGRKIAGNAAPLSKNLDDYLRKHPHCERYVGQDRATRYTHHRKILPVGANVNLNVNAFPQNIRPTPVPVVIQPHPSTEVVAGLPFQVPHALPVPVGPMPMATVVGYPHPPLTTIMDGRAAPALSTQTPESVVMYAAPSQPRQIFYQAYSSAMQPPAPGNAPSIVPAPTVTAATSAHSSEDDASTVTTSTHLAYTGFPFRPADATPELALRQDRLPCSEAAAREHAAAAIANAQAQARAQIRDSRLPSRASSKPNQNSAKPAGKDSPHNGQLPSATTAEVRNTAPTSMEPNNRDRESSAARTPPPSPPSPVMPHTHQRVSHPNRPSITSPATHQNQIHSRSQLQPQVEECLRGQSQMQSSPRSRARSHPSPRSRAQPESQSLSQASPEGQINVCEDQRLSSQPSDRPYSTARDHSQAQPLTHSGVQIFKENTMQPHNSLKLNGTALDQTPDSEKACEESGQLSPEQFFHDVKLMMAQQKNSGAARKLQNVHQPQNVHHQQNTQPSQASHYQQITHRSNQNPHATLSVTHRNPSTTASATEPVSHAHMNSREFMQSQAQAQAQARAHAQIHEQAQAQMHALLYAHGGLSEDIQSTEQSGKIGLRHTNEEPHDFDERQTPRREDLETTTHRLAGTRIGNEDAYVMRHMEENGEYTGGSGILRSSSRDMDVSCPSNMALSDSFKDGSELHDCNGVTGCLVQGNGTCNGAIASGSQPGDVLRRKKQADDIDKVLNEACSSAHMSIHSVSLPLNGHAMEQFRITNGRIPNSISRSFSFLRGGGTFGSREGSMEFRKGQFASGARDMSIEIMKRDFSMELVGAKKIGSQDPLGVEGDIPRDMSVEFFGGPLRTGSRDMSLELPVDSRTLPRGSSIRLGTFGDDCAMGFLYQHTGSCEREDSVKESGHGDAMRTSRSKGGASSDDLMVHVNNGSTVSAQGGWSQYRRGLNGSIEDFPDLKTPF